MRKNKGVFFKALLCVLVGSVLSGAAGALASSLTPKEIMQKSDDRYRGDTRTSDAVLTLIDKKERRRVREMKMYSMDSDEVEKSVMFFSSPADVKNTSYMSFDWEDDNKEDDSWLYLPALQKIKRVASSDESGSFMGSDFTYADINGLDYDDYSYKMVNESEEVDDADCWVIDSDPLDESVVDKTGALSSRVWIRKDNFMQVKAIINMKKGKRVKYFAAKDIVKIDDIWTAKTVQMVTTKNGKKLHASVLKISNVQYNKGVDKKLFDTQAMMRGI